MTTDQVIDSAPAEAEAEVSTPEVDNVVEAEAQEIEQPQEEGSEGEGGEEEAKEPDLPKEVKKALDKNKRYIRNLREREKGLLAEIEKLKSEKIEAKTIDADSFQGSYGELIKQQSMEEMKAMLGQNQQQAKLDQLTLQQQQIMAEQSQAIQLEAIEYGKQSEDFAKVVPANADRFNVLPAEIQSLFFELESPPLAAYALAKEGKIEQLAFMSPYMAAAELVQAQARGQRYLQESSKKQVSNAPAPIGSLKGTGKTQQKSIFQMTPTELDKWRKT